MNVPLLQDIKARILAEPDAFRMDTWSCGTAHCIAGWACLLTGNPIVNGDADGWEQHTADFRSPEDVAVEALALDAWSDEEVRLFHVQQWPNDFASRYLNMEGSRAGRAQIAAERIDHFIATDGAE